MDERQEALMRIPIGLGSGIIIGLWAALIRIIAIMHWIVVLITGRRDKDLAEFAEMFNTQLYIFARYMTFVTNIRPFPFTKIEKNMSKFK